MDKKLIKDIVISLIPITVITIITLGSMIFYHSFLKFTIPKSVIDYTYGGIVGLFCLVLFIILSLVRLHQLKVRKTEVTNENI